jgi:hypothetical protein
MTLLIRVNGLQAFLWWIDFSIVKMFNVGSNQARYLARFLFMYILQQNTNEVRRVALILTQKHVVYDADCIWKDDEAYFCPACFARTNSVVHIRIT